MLVLADGWFLDDPLRLTVQKWIKKMQTDTEGRIQISYLDVNGPTNSKTGAVAGFASWEEERQFFDIVWGTPDLFYLDFPIARSLKWFVYGTDIKGSLNVCNQIHKEFPEIQAQYTRIGMKRLCGFAGVGIVIQTKDKPIRKLNDFNGLKLSISGTSYEFFNQLGASEIEVPQGREYLSVAKGEVDGTEGWIEFLKTFPGAETIRYTTYLHIPFPALDFYGINLETWNRFPQDIQKVFEDNAEWFYDEMTNAQLRLTQQEMEKAKAKGHEFIELPAQDLNKLNSIVEKVALRKAAELDTRGLPGTKIFRRTRQLISEYERTKGSRG